MKYSSLNNLTYQKFLKNFTIYPSKKEARKKGFEAHHIIPIFLQRKTFNKIHNQSLSAKEFQNTKYFDDSCIRCTCFEHLIAHYLLARENNDCKYVFSQMISRRFSTIPYDDKEILSLLEHFGKIKEEGYKIRGQLHKEKIKGRHHFTDGIHEVLTYECPPGYHLGQSPSHTLKQAQNNPGATGFKHFTDGIHHIFTKNCPPNYYPGVPNKYKEKAKRKKHFTNGDIEILAETCPEGFYPGRSPKARLNMKAPKPTIKGMHWFNNGLKNIRSYTCPEGFLPGKISKN